MARHVYVFPTSFSQQRLWLLDRLTPGHAFYNIPAALRVSMSIDPPALQRAIDLLVRRHESLRTSFVELDGHPLQVVGTDVNACLHFVDLVSARDVDSVAEAERLVRIESTRPFDLAHAPLVRFALASLGERDHILMVTCHHIIADGMSMEILFRDLRELYRAQTGRGRCRLPVLRAQFADFSVWQRTAFPSAALETQLSYWRTQLADLPGSLALPTDHMRHAEQQFRGAMVPVKIKGPLARALRDLAQRTDASLFMVLLAGFATLLHRYTGDSDVVIGSPVAGRHYAELDLNHLVGFFVNTLALRSKIHGDPTVREFIASVRETALTAFGHQDVPFEQVVSAVAPRRVLAHQPLFQVMFGLQSADGTARAPMTSPDGRGRIAVETGTAKCDLTLSLTETSGGIHGYLEYDVDLFDQATIDRIREGLLLVLHAMTDDVDCPVSSLPLLPSDVRRLLVEEWNRTDAPYPSDTPVHRLVQQQAAVSPDAVAVRDGTTIVTYRELVHRAHRLARRLVAAGIRRGDRVAVCLERSPTMIAAWLGVLRAGAAYVPLDPEYPQRRLALLIEDAGASIVIADAHSRPILPAGPAHILDVDDDTGGLDVDSVAEESPDEVDGHDAAYVVYTSGSTGAPKGTVVPHAAIARLVINTNYIAIDASDRIAQAANASFDAATFEVWGALVHGACVVIVPRHVTLDPHGFADLLRTDGITTLFLTTALFNQIVAQRPDAFHSLDRLLVGGEMADVSKFRDVLRHGPPASLLHVYGPTETTTFATYFHVDRVADGARTIPIGKPLSNTRVYVVDGHLELVPIGVPGELVIAGDGVALGYLGRPELTAERFIDERWRPNGGRAYRTGDLVRYRSDGSLEILGRLDQQLKIRGFRVEPAEVEASLAQHRDVAYSVVVPRAVGNDTRLVAYVVPSTRSLTAAGLRTYLRERLPDYMVPAAIVLLDRIPLTSNGKLDRGALPAPDLNPTSARIVAPRTAAEAALAAVWAEVLCVASVGVEDNFFELGGDSIRAIQVVARAGQAGLRFTPRQLFQHQTIAELAASLEAHSVAPAEQGLVLGDVPLTPIQHWFFERAPEEPHHFNQAVLVELSAETSVRALEVAAGHLLRHHDALRLRFEREDDSWRQWIAAPDDGPVVSRHDLSGGDGSDHDALIARIASEVQRSLNLARGPIVRFAIFDRGAAHDSRLLIVVHHLAVDIVSWPILLEDLQLALQQAGAGSPVQLPAKTMSFKAWAERLRALGDEASDGHQPVAPEIWRRACVLPSDGPPDGADNVVGRARIVTVTLDAESTRALVDEAAPRLDARVPELVAAALLTALRTWTGRDEFVVDIEGHGRDALTDDVDVSRTVGWFTTITPVFFRLPDAGTDPIPIVRSVCATLSSRAIGSAAHFVRRYLSTDEAVRTRMAQLAEAPIAFNYLGRFQPGDHDLADAPGAPLSGPNRSERGLRRHLIEIDGGIVRDRLTMHWTYGPAHGRDTIEKVAADFVSALRRIVSCTMLGAAGLSSHQRADASVSVPVLSESLRRAVPDAEDGYPLSPLQEGMLFHALYEPRGGQHVVQMVMPLAGSLDTELFREAWALVIGRHPILRTSFVWDGIDAPVQVVHTRVTPAWYVQDWRLLSLDTCDTQLHGYLAQERQTGFDTSHAPLMRFALIRVSEAEWRFLWTCHHLLLDGWSRPLVLREVADAYEALSRDEVPRAPARRPYRDYVRWLAAQDAEAADRFWRERLQDVTSATPIVSALPGSPAPHDAGFDSRRCVLSQSVTAQLEATLRRHQLTLGTIVHGAWAVLLGRYTRSRDVLFGTTVSGRPPDLPGVEEMIGPFINTLPARIAIEDALPATQWLRDVQAQLVIARQFEYSPLVAAHRCSAVPPGTPLFESLVVVENYPGTVGSSAGDLRTESIEWTNYPLTLSAIPGASLALELGFARHIHSAAIAGMLEQITCFLTGFAEHPERPVAAIPLMTEAERRLLTDTWNATDVTRAFSPVHEVVQLRAQRDPDQIAIVCGDTRLRYGDLVARARALAERLRVAGVGRGNRVGVFLDRSADLPVAMLAVLEAGAAYVPLETTFPRERLAIMVADAAVEVVLTRNGLMEAVAALDSRLIVVATDATVDHRSVKCHDQAAPRAGEPVQPEDPAYVVYTSGTTGVPRGVVVGHRALVNHMFACVDLYTLDASDRVLQMAVPAFDVAAEEIFPALAAGATIVMWSDALAPSVTDLMRFVEAHAVTVLNVPTPFWHEWVDDIDRGGSPVPACIRRVIVGTDRASVDKLARWRAAVGDRVRWCNAYGCTETTITSIVYETTDGTGDTGLRATVPVGRPIANSRAYVVDERLELVPVGVPGELVVAGDGVALGYVQRSDQAQEKFIDERWRVEGGRAYRTGDLARWRADGVLEVLGRLDDQVKIRGYRVEPSEIAATVALHAAVRQVAVVPQLLRGETQLVAYVVVDHPVADADLRAFLRDKLPAYLVPAAFVPLERLPVTANGKLHRAALPAPVVSLQGDNRTPPRTPTETTVAAIWADVLGVEGIGVHDNFFELGGHSLTATRVVSRIRQVTGCQVPLRLLFDHPTVAELATQLESATVTPLDPPIERRRESGPCPLSFAQERLWFLDRLSPGTPLYNMPCSMHVDGALDLVAMEASLNEVVRRHETLRTTFAVLDGRPVQVVARSLRIPLRVVDLRGLEQKDRLVEATREGAADARRPFDLERGPLIRAMAMQLGPREHVLLLTMHHIVADGWSVGVLLKELRTCYDALSRGRPSPLGELPIQYGDYAVWQRTWLQGEALQQQLRYWRQQLGGSPISLELPTDWPRPSQRRSLGSYETLALSPELTAALRALTEREGVTLFVLVLAAWQLLLSRWSGQDDICVGTPVAGRSRTETEGLIGFFLNNLVMRTRLDGDPSFRQLLGRARETALGGFAHEDIPFERLLAELDPPRDPSRTPLFQVFLNVLTFDEERMQLPDAVAESFSLAGGRAAGDRDDDRSSEDRADPEVWSQFDLTLYAGERGGRLRFVLVYDTDLFAASRVAEMLDQLTAILAQAVKQPDAPIARFTLLTPRALRVLPDPRAPLDDTWIGSVPTLFERRALASPDRAAVEDDRESWTYDELNRRSSQLAHWLRARGVGRGDVVALYAARCAGLVWGLLGVLKAGAAFTVLDPRYPPARLAAHVAVARPAALVQIEGAGPLPDELGRGLDAVGAVPSVLLPSLAAAVTERLFRDLPATSPPLDVGPDDPACVGFTSGSTGVPKGIVGRHGPLTHFLPWLVETFGLSPEDRFSMLSGLSHDPLQREVFTPLCVGGTICVPGDADYEDGSRLVTWMARARATVAHLTPALGQLLVQGAHASTETVHRLPALRRAFFVGDVLRTHDVARLIEVAPDVTCINYYGSTETQRSVGYFVVTPKLLRATSGARSQSSIPAGRGVQDVQLLVLNLAGELCGVGELGEIHVRSPHLAIGYLGDDALTVQRFLVNPFAGGPGDRLYRTGDLGRYLPDGDVAFAGRRDSQVKIRGFRVELTEIEAVLSQHPGVRESAVIVRDDEPRLVGYVVPADASLSASELKQLVAARLPAYMVPAHIVMLASLPLTPNGKLDRVALPQPRGSSDVRDRQLRTSLEAAVAAIWSEVLAVDVTDVDEGFFEAGGHSLLSTPLLARVRTRFGVDVSLAQFFARPTVAGLAAAIEEARRTSASQRQRPSLRRLPRAQYRARVGQDGQPVLGSALRDHLLSVIQGVRPR